MNQENFTIGIPTKTKRKKNLRKIFKTTRRFITITAFVMGTIFGYLQLSGINYDPLKTDGFADTLMNISLLIYFLAWLNGTLMDLKDEEAIFIFAPNNDKLNVTAIGTMVTLGIIFFCLCFFKSFKEFIIVLDILFVVNVISWRILIRFIENSVLENKEFYKNEHKYFKTIYLQLLIDDYLKGRWQWWRFLAGFIILIFVNILIFTNLSSAITVLLKLNTVDLVKALGFFFFILVMEGWIWFMRMKRSNCIELLDHMDEEYYLMERKK